MNKLKLITINLETFNHALNQIFTKHLSIYSCNFVVMLIFCVMYYSESTLIQIK